MTGESWKTRLKMGIKRINFYVFPFAAIPFFFGIALLSVMIESREMLFIRLLFCFVFVAITIFLLYFGTFKSEEQIKEEERKEEIIYPLPTFGDIFGCIGLFIQSILKLVFSLVALILFIWLIKAIWYAV
jgi:hypothetical protein